MTELILKEEVYQIVGAAMDVYYTLGRGFLEPVYQEALEIELERRNIPFEAQKLLNVDSTRDINSERSMLPTLSASDRSSLK
ncbi:MAG TPA: GxxExxY protein [Pyrinomonadaceae bacterium]|nr:GxxExxY protein [Pyrinomonadaceae bacterium]